MDRKGAGARLEGLFGDGGRALLRSAGVPSWAAALDELDPDPGEAPVDQLAALRDHWHAIGAVEAAIGAGGAVVGLCRRELGDEDPRTLRELARLGRAMFAEDPDQAELIVERAWESACELAPGDPERARVAAVVGGLRLLQDRPNEAIFPLREAIRVLESVEPRTASQASFDLGRSTVEFGSVEEGLRLVEASVRDARRAPVAGPELPERLSVYAAMIAERISPKDAEGVHREAVEAAARVHGEMSPEAAVAHAALAAVLFRFPKRAEEAMGMMDVAVSLLVGSAGPSDLRTRSVAAQHVERLIELGRSAADRRDRTLARECFSRAEAISLEVFGPGDGRLVRVRDYASRI